MTKATEAALNKLTKWRALFAGWQLGTRTIDDPESNAVRDHRELTLILRAEVSALLSVLIKKGVFEEADFDDALFVAAKDLDAGYEQRFPGFSTSAVGLHVDLKRAVETMKQMNFKP